MPTKSMSDSEVVEKEVVEGDRSAHRVLDSDQIHSEGPTQEEIAAVAYQLWVERGSPHGSHEEDWQKAEEELRGRSGMAKGAGA